MTPPHYLHHALLRPCVLHILRAAGYHSTRPSVLDALTDLAARYMYALAEATAEHAAVNHHGGRDLTVIDVRMALQDCAALLPEKTPEEQEYDGVEDTRGVDAFLAWAAGKASREIRRVAVEAGDGVADDYLTALKKKHSATDAESRYIGTVLGHAVEPRAIKIEGADISSVREWSARLRASSATPSTTSSRRQSSALSSLGDSPMEGVEF